MLSVLGALKKPLLKNLDSLITDLAHTWLKEQGLNSNRVKIALKSTGLKNIRNQQEKSDTHQKVLLVADTYTGLQLTITNKPLAITDIAFYQDTKRFQWPEHFGGTLKCAPTKSKSTRISSSTKFYKKQQTEAILPNVRIINRPYCPFTKKALAWLQKNNFSPEFILKIIASAKKVKKKRNIVYHCSNFNLLVTKHSTTQRITAIEKMNKSSPIPSKSSSKKRKQKERSGKVST